LSFFAQNKAKLCKNLIITLIFEKTPFSAENWQNRRKLRSLQRPLMLLWKHRPKCSQNRSSTNFKNKTFWVKKLAINLGDSCKFHKNEIISNIIRPIWSPSLATSYSVFTFLRAWPLALAAKKFLAITKIGKVERTVLF
jgi:hypothetical protein